MSDTKLEMAFSDKLQYRLSCIKSVLELIYSESLGLDDAFAEGSAEKMRLHRMQSAICACEEMADL